MEREWEEERRRKMWGNKLETEKEGSVQSLGEKTLKFDCENGMEYHDFWVEIVFKVWGGSTGIILTKHKPLLFIKRN